MLYCKEHDRIAYTVEEFEELKDSDICRYGGSYQNAGDKKIRIYCFRAAFSDGTCRAYSGQGGKTNGTGNE